MKIKIELSCKHLNFLSSSITYFEINYNSSLNVIISLGPIPCLHFVTRMLYIWKVIIGETLMSDYDW